MLADVSAGVAATVRVVHSLTHSTTSDIQLKKLQHITPANDTYVRLRECVPHRVPGHQYDLHNTLLDFWKICKELYCDGDLVLYGPRIVVPAASRKTVLQSLHASHCEAEATKSRANQTVARDKR